MLSIRKWGAHFMTDEAPFFVTRDGIAWACWLSGRPAVKLGAKSEVLAAMTKFLAESDANAQCENRPAATVPQGALASPCLAPAAAPTPRKHAPKVERLETRHDLCVIGRVHTGKGARDISVLDLSERGCRFYDRFGHLAEGAVLTIKIGPIGPLVAAVRWREGEYVGAEFNSPLYPSVLEHIRQHFDLRH
jgi:hypothetical protein